MARVFKMKEIKVVVKNSPGMLARVTEPISNARVNIGAFITYEKGNEAEFYFITADNEKVKMALEEAGFKTEEQEVVVVEVANESGILAKVAKQLSDSGVDLLHAYSTAGNIGTTWIILATKTIKQAMGAIP